MAYRLAAAFRNVPRNALGCILTMSKNNCQNTLIVQPLTSISSANIGPIERNSAFDKEFMKSIKSLECPLATNKLKRLDKKVFRGHTVFMVHLLSSNTTFST